jgi:pSer/pThr/pTyr-binding forkhead associated (FHA) protein
MQSHLTRGRETLILSSGNLVLRSVELSKPIMVIGRRPYCDIALDDLTVSGEHASLSLEADRRILRDLRSRNRVFVNGQAINQASLVHGDMIQIGVYQLRFEVRVEEPTASKRKRAFKTDEPAPSVALLETMSGPQSGKKIALDRAITSIGAAGPHVAVIRRRSSGYYLTHLEGPSPPMINGEPIGLMAYPLAHNDLIELGPITFRFEHSA